MATPYQKYNAALLKQYLAKLDIKKIDWSQLEKGGPGSGRYPAGSGGHSSQANRKGVVEEWDFINREGNAYRFGRVGHGKDATIRTLNYHGNVNKNPKLHDKLKELGAYDERENAKKEKTPVAAPLKSHLTGPDGYNRSFNRDWEVLNGVYKAQNERLLRQMLAKGGPGSGNHGHAGIPGQRGGSAARGESGGGEEQNVPIISLGARSATPSDASNPEMIIDNSGKPEPVPPKDLSPLEMAVTDKDGNPIPVGTGSTPADKERYQNIYDLAHEEGMGALRGATPTPMVVSQHENMMDDNSKPVKQWFVSEGACGFAWVNIYPANTSFARHLKATGVADNAYGGGMQVWVREGGQSIERKEKYANAMADRFQKHGIKAYSGSRLD